MLAGPLHGDDEGLGRGRHHHAQAALGLAQVVLLGELVRPPVPVVHLELEHLPRLEVVVDRELGLPVGVQVVVEL